MTSLIFKSDNFKCHLECGQCTYMKDNGTRCRNRVCFGIPTCWIHTIKEYNVRLRPSTLPAGGKGLFSTAEIARDEWICPYIGEKINSRCLELRYPGDMTAPYAVQNTRNEYIDSACKRGIGSMVNGKFSATGRPQPRNQHNAIIKKRRGQGIWIKSTKIIPANREIFVHYGNDYHLEHNHETKRTKNGDNRPC